MRRRIINLVRVGVHHEDTHVLVCTEDDDGMSIKHIRRDELKAVSVCIYNVTLE